MYQDIEPNELLLCMEEPQTLVGSKVYYGLPMKI